MIHFHPNADEPDSPLFRDDDRNLADLVDTLPSLGAALLRWSDQRGIQHSLLLPTAAAWELVSTIRDQGVDNMNLILR